MLSPTLVGIVNITPDSFSDGGNLGDAAVEHARKLVSEGADILDLGAESTRPGAVALTAEEEWARLGPVLKQIHDAPWSETIRLSVDTYHAETASRALELGVPIINDVSGLKNEAMAELLGNHECDMVVMHSLSLPSDPNVTLSPECDVVAEILSWKKEIVKRADSLGIAPERLIFDPGIGFGKTADQSLTLIQEAKQLTKTGGRWMYGHSRKSFLKKLQEVQSNIERDALTREISKQLAEARVSYLRVHDITGHRQMFDRLCT